MAVYSHITKNELVSLLKKYQIGTLIKFEGILEGIENTNYKLITSKQKYILTIFEKRVEFKDLPFFIDLKNHLIKKKFICPQPIQSKDGKYINIFNEKPFVIVSFLDGKKIPKIKNEHCKQVGFTLAELHKKSEDYIGQRSNNMNYKQWENIFLKCKKKSVNQYNFIQCDYKKTKA